MCGLKLSYSNIILNYRLFQKFLNNFKSLQTIYHNNKISGEFFVIALAHIINLKIQWTQKNSHPQITLGSTMSLPLIETPNISFQYQILGAGTTLISSLVFCFSSLQ